MAEIVTETVTIKVMRLAKKGQTLPTAVTDDHRTTLEAALEEIWDFDVPGVVVEIAESD